MQLPRQPGSLPPAACCTATSRVCSRGSTALLAEHGLNIEQQVLSTTGAVGFAVTDVPGTVGPDVVAELRQMPETIRAHALLP